ncbi:MAG: hypothetical protein KAR42_05415 [candidate division Zixibacteria bacterium]|nr:hypothetical protein [candidate division Zixibacteria bacterium]
MKLAGYLSAKLADSGEIYERDLVEKINEKVNPPKPLAKEDVFIRAMYIVSDQINSQGGKFDDDELDILTELLPDAPVMIGHNRETLPVARNFYAIRTSIENRIWIKSYFYWMKDSAGAADLQKNIDGGIYKECSISFTFELPECSVCGKDIRQCRHIPFREYVSESGMPEIAHFKYRRIRKVLETSLVFRGAIPDTRITDKLGEIDYNKATTIPAVLFSKIPNGDEKLTGAGYRNAKITFERIEKHTLPHNCNSVLACPYQPGIPLRISKTGKKVDIASSLLLPDAITNLIIDRVSKLDCHTCLFDILLYATQGKNRLNGFSLRKIIDSENNLHRLHMRLTDLLTINDESLAEHSLQTRLEKALSLRNMFAKPEVEIIRYRVLDRDNLPLEKIGHALARYKYGLEIIAETSQGVSRHIYNRQELTPGRVEDIISRKNRSLCRIKVLNGSVVNDAVSCASSHRLEKDDTVVAIVGKNKTGQTRLHTIYDILPGTESVDIATTDLQNVSPNSESIFIYGRGLNLKIIFQRDGVFHEATVHCFQQKLFEEGRRFVADVKEINHYTTAGTTEIPVQTIYVSGGIISFNLKHTNKEQDDILGFHLRPVIIDGDERYLFYIPSVNYLPGEL